MTDAQKKLDQSYENGGFIVGAEAYAAGWQSDAAAFRDATRCDLDVVYGAHPRAKFDLFWPEGTPKGLMVFVHGGYWVMRAKSDWSHFAEGGLAKGYAVALIGYPLAPEVRVREITAFIQLAIRPIAARVAGPIVLAGHSAGGHLVARMAMAGVLPEAIAQRVTHAMAISPVSDLRPLMGLTLNETLHLTEKEAVAESPALGAPRAGLPVTVAVGAEERPVFLDHARWLVEAWRCGELVLAGRHHFDILDELRNPDSRMLRTLFSETV